MIIYYMDEYQNLLLFGEKLKTFRKNKKMTQSQLAEQMGLSPNFIGMIERAERNTNVSNVFKFARLLDVNPKDFFDY